MPPSFYLVSNLYNSAIMSTPVPRLKIGEGKISGFVSIFLGLLSLTGVLCFKYPEWLTTPQFREVYTGASMKIVLTSAIIASFLFALVSFMLSKQKKWAVTGLIICTLAIVFGGFQVEGRS